jgi:hypothetical protein
MRENQSAMSASKKSSLDIPAEGDLPGEQLASSASTLRGEATPNEEIKDDHSASYAVSITANANANANKEDHGSNHGMDETDDVEYPSGLKMFFIVLALVLSIFLLALDMVSNIVFCQLQTED